MKAASRPSLNPAMIAQVGLVLIGVMLVYLVAALGWPSGEGSVRFFILVVAVGLAVGGVMLLDKVKIRTQFPLSAEGAGLFAAWQALIQQNWRAALSAYQGVLDKHPRSTEALLHAALLEIQFDQIATAEAHLGAVIETCGDDPEVRHAQALLLHNQGKYAEAAEAYARLTEPHDYRSRTARAIALYQAGDRDRAYEEIRAAAGQYTQTRFRRSVDIEMPSWALAQGMYFLAPNQETADRETLRIFQWTESLWAGWSWSKEFDALDEATKFRERHMLNLKVLIGKIPEEQLTDLFDARDLEAQYILSGWFTVAVKAARAEHAGKARAAWTRFLDEAKRWSTPPLIPSACSFEGSLARFELARGE